MNGDSPRTCSACGAAMSAIVLLDRVTINGAQLPVEYALPGAKASRWTGRVPVAGTIEAERCDGCGRVALYGVPK